MRSQLIVCLLGLAVILSLGASTAWADSTIYQVRTGVYPTGTVVECDSVVVTAVGLFVYFVEEPIPDPVTGRQYSGIQVYTANNHACHRGDIMNIKGTYSEYDGMSELSVLPAGSFQTIVSHATVPPPVVVGIDDINTLGPLAEAYECVFCRVEPSPNLYTFAPNATGEWNVRYTTSVGGDSLTVGHWASPKPGDDFLYVTPPAGTNLTYIQGIDISRYGLRLLDPRDCETDLGVLSCAPALLAAYSTSSTNVNVEFSVNVDATTSGTIGNYIFSSGLGVVSAARDATYHKVVHLTTTAQTDTLAEEISVSNVTAELGGAVMSPNQTYDFLDGFTPLKSCQYPPDPATGNSPHVSSTVTVHGRVAAAQGLYYFLQSGNGGPWNALYSRVAASSPPAVGDSIMVSGKLTEYYNETELAYTTGADNYVNYGKAPHAIVTTTVEANQIPFRDTNHTGEPYEDVLVKLANVTLQDSLPGVVGPYAGEWIGRQLVNPVHTDTVSVDWLSSNPSGGAAGGIANLQPLIDPCVGDRLDATGVLRYVYGAYRICSRTGRGGDVIYLYDNPACAPTSVGDHASLQPVTLHQNQPNPFGRSTEIRFTLPAARSVNLEILDVAGRLVKVLASGTLSAGEHSISWDATNATGHAVASGTYFYRLRGNGNEMARKMIIVQ